MTLPDRKVVQLNFKLNYTESSIYSSTTELIMWHVIELVVEDIDLKVE